MHLVFRSTAVAPCSRVCGIFPTILEILGFFCVTTDLYGNSINNVDGWLRKIENRLRPSSAIKGSEATGITIFSLIVATVGAVLIIIASRMLAKSANVVWQVSQNGIERAAQHYSVPYFRSTDPLRYYYIPRFIIDTVIHVCIWIAILCIGLAASVWSFIMMSYVGILGLLRTIESITFKHCLLLIGAGLFLAAKCPTQNCIGRVRPAPFA